MEIWKPLKEDSHFQISNLGRVRSKDRNTSEDNKVEYTIPGRIYKPRISPTGYVQACLRIDKKYKYFYVHRLVAEYFLEGLNSNKEVNHIDGNKLNNTVENLEVVSRKENARHAKLNRLYSSGEAHGSTKLSNLQVIQIRELSRDGYSNKEIANMFQLTVKYVWAITTYKTWKYLEEKNV